MKEVLILYSTSACHLCDQALEVIDTVLDLQYFDKKIIDIAESDALIEEYGTRIPVLKFARTNEELGWPFGAEELVAFIGKSMG